MPSLVVQGEGKEEIYGLSAPSVTLGRGLESDIRLKDIRASRRHCQIVRAGAGYKVVDISNGNTVLVNGKPIAKEQVLQFGDRIRIGGTQVLFTSDNAPPRPTTKTPLSPEERERAFQMTSRNPVVKADEERGGKRPVTTRTGGATNAGGGASRPVKPGATGQTSRIGSGSRRVVPTATQRLGHGTQRAGTSTTGRLRLGAQRVGKTSHRMKSLPARQGTASRGARNPMIIAAVGGVLLLAGVVAFFFFQNPPEAGQGSRSGKAREDTAEVIQAKARSAEQGGEYGKAITLLDDLLQKYPDSPQAAAAKKDVLQCETQAQKLWKSTAAGIAKLEKAEAVKRLEETLAKLAGSASEAPCRQKLDELKNQ